MTLACSSVGDGPPLLILHGLFGAGHNWARIAKHMAGQGWRVLSPDLRNHGTSPWADTMTYPAMADDLSALLDAKADGGPALVIGHSMGGKAAMWLALTEPARVRGLVAVDVAPVAYPPGRVIEAYAQAMQALPLDQLTRRADADAALTDAVPERGIRAFLLQNLDLPGPEGGSARWRLNLDVLAAALPTITGWPNTPPEAHYEGPTLALFGEASGYVRPDHHAAMRALFPAVRFEGIPDAGHWVHAENPPATLAALERFLQTV
ncbi:alpha/beta fold hydrolase [Roseospira marina]|nr:alpha/beta fold hydrolase [Roseospira marina]MBB4312443.1 pimeloyl-ACP methyl ester carboxylesterase [Roseospira marina]MBB5085541.1 pimeloyl-ACP methyl ester carboxylesterase [Roseospira marina]